MREPSPLCAFDEAFFAASALSWRRGLETRLFSAVELFDAVWARMLDRNPTLNALAAYDEEQGRANARRADGLYATQQARALEGLPVTVKDSFETAGLRTSCGAEILADHVPAQDAEAVARLRAAGANIFAKTNVPTLTGDFQTFNPLYGVSCNPWNADLTPGGSSGGAAAAVASGLSAFDLSSDLGGSIRWPAQACGLFGLKPSWGVVPLAGHIPPMPGVRLKKPPDLAVAGPLARSAGDLALAFEILSGAAAPLPRIEALRVALWLDPRFAPVDADVEAGVAMAADVLRDAGASVETAQPDVAFEEIFEIYALLSFAIGYAGAAAETKQYFAAQAKNFSDGDLSYPALRARAAKFDAALFSALMTRRAAVDRAFAAFFARYDAILCPLAPCLAFPHDFSPDFFARRIETSQGALPYYDLLKWASPASLGLLPAVAAPVAVTPRGLPTGAQIFCARGADGTALALAAALEQASGGFRAPK